MDGDRDAKVFEARACGKSAHEVAREFGLTVKEVEDITAAKVRLQIELHAASPERAQRASD